MVAWTEYNSELTYPIAWIKTRYVESNGSLGTTVNDILQCEPESPLAGPPGTIVSTASATGSFTTGTPTGSRVSNGSCKGFWFTSSEHSYSEGDRYRLHHYAQHTRLNADGEQVGELVEQECSTYCPVTAASDWYGSDFAPFQILRLGENNETWHSRLAQDDETMWFEERYAVGKHFPQAFRSNRHVAAAIATSTTAPSTLWFSVVDMYQGGCRN